MKSRELLVWALLVVAIILLINKCGGDNNPVNPVDTVYVKGQTDTVIRRDTVTVVVFRNNPQAVKTESIDSSDFDGGVTIGLRNPCDSIRIYQDSAINSRAGAFVLSTVRGELLDQEIQLRSYTSDTSFTRVDTIIETWVIPIDYTLSVAASVDLNNGPGLGVQVGLKRWSVAYQYFPMNKSNQLMVGYRLFKR